MTNPTEDHNQQAREIVLDFYTHQISTRLIEDIALILAARDAGVREVLEGLRMGGKHDGGCWCIESPTRTRQSDWRHNKYCKAASALYARVAAKGGE